MTLHLGILFSDPHLRHYPESRLFKTTSLPDLPSCSQFSLFGVPRRTHFLWEAFLICYEDLASNYPEMEKVLWRTNPQKCSPTFKFLRRTWSVWTRPGMVNTTRLQQQRPWAYRCQTMERKNVSIPAMKSWTQSSLSWSQNWTDCAICLESPRTSFLESAQKQDKPSLSSQRRVKTVFSFDENDSEYNDQIS